jgi:hypothetical protein
MMPILVLSLMIISHQAFAFVPVGHPGLLQNSISFYAVRTSNVRRDDDENNQIQHCIPLDQLSLDDLPRVGGCVF